MSNNYQDQPSGPLKGYKDKQNQNRNQNGNNYDQVDDRGSNNPRGNWRGRKEEGNPEGYVPKNHYNYEPDQGFYPKNNYQGEDQGRDRNQYDNNFNRPNHQKFNQQKVPQSGNTNNERGGTFRKNQNEYEIKTNNNFDPEYNDRFTQSSRDFSNGRDHNPPKFIYQNRNQDNQNYDPQERKPKQGMEIEIPTDITSISARTNKNCDYQLTNELKQIIDLSSHYANIEITLTDLDPTLIKQFTLVKDKFQRVNLHFQTLPQQIKKYPNNQNIPPESNSLIHNPTEQLNEQRIYQFQEQIENQVPQNMKLIIFHWKIMPQFILDSLRNNLQIQVNSADSQYKVDGNDLNKATQFFNKMKSDLDSSVIVLQECKSDIEARSILNILEKGQIYNSLQNILNSKMVIVDSTTQLNLDSFKNASSLNDQVLYLKKRQATVFAIVQNLEKVSIKILQERFIQFIQDPKYVKLLKDQSQFELSHSPDLNAINKEIQNLDFQGFEIYISEPNMDYRIGKYVIEVTYTLWYPGNISEANGQQMMTKIKNSIYGIFNPIISIILENKQQKEIWQDYLNSHFEKNQDKIQIKTVKNANNIEIKLIGDVDKCRSMKEKITDELDSIHSLELDLKYKGNKNILNILAEQSYQEQIFRKQLNQIQSEYQNLRIQITQIFKKSSTIQFKIQFKDGLTQEDIKELLLKEVISKIESFSQKMEFRKFLKYLDLDDDTFEETYGMIVSDSNDSITFISTQEYIQKVKDLIKEFHFAIEQQNRIVTIKFDSNLLFQKIQQMIISKKLELLEDVKCNFIGTTIQLVGPNESVSVLQDMIIATEQQLKSQLITLKLDLNEKEVNFFNKNLKSKMESQLKQFDCEINTSSSQMSSRNCVATTLSFQGRQLSVAYADISKFECDAIVNSCNNLMSFGDVDMLSGVARKIFDVAGAHYTSFCEKYIQKHQTLKFGEAITYKMQNGGAQKYIINVSTPIYKDGQQTNQDLLIIEQNIKAIFCEANKRNIKTIALPIFGGGACGYSFKQISQNVLNALINNLYSPYNQIVQTVYVTEFNESKLTQISQVFKQILQPPQSIRQIKYQWWAEGNQYKNYDDEDINRQIDEGFEQFQNQGKTLELKLIFPFTKQPGTHLVNLKTMTITDIALKNIIQLSLQTVNGNKRFLFDGQQIDDVINEYLMLQQLNKIQEFQIFYKKHKIIFNINGTIQQLNEATGYSRDVQPRVYQQNKQQTNQNILIGKNVKLENRTYDKQVNQQYEIVVETFDIQVFNDLQKIIKQEISKHTMDFNPSLPLIKEEDFNDLKAFIIQNSIQAYGDIQNGQKLNLKIFKKKEAKIQAQIDMVISNKKKYPIEWIQQDKNSIKVDLSRHSQEYQEIQAEFQKTYSTGKIYKISRLQNQRLWENYQLEQQNLQDLALKRNTPLTPIETERYLWHGVRGSHPKIIYESMKEAFDMTYSNEGMWGTGIYFAERAEYSKRYSYNLTQHDDPLLANKLVFLCCKVATGKIHSCNPDNTLKRPPNGFDCVSGFTNGSTVFILYGMDVRRAYPAYEIIYE